MADTTQAQAPTDEILKTARTIADGLFYHGVPSDYAFNAIAQALAAQDRLAVERCAKLAGAHGGGGPSIARKILALRAQGEK